MCICMYACINIPQIHILILHTQIQTRTHPDADGRRDGSRDDGLPIAGEDDRDVRVDGLSMAGEDDRDVRADGLSMAGEDDRDA